jgi:uncharacterized membrane protein (DUF373 family)
MEKPTKHLIKAIKVVETLLAIFILITVIVSSYDLLRIFYTILTTPDPNKSYDFFHELLSHALLLVIGLELAIMLVKHTPGSVIEVILFAVARKMLIYYTSAYETAIGVLSIAGLFAIRKFLFVSRIENVEECAENWMDECIIDGKTPITTANNLIGLQLPEETAASIGEIIVKLAAGEEIKPGSIFQVSNTKLEILEVKNGFPEKIKVLDYQRK